MAKVLKNFEFNLGRHHKYNWATWLDGRIWQMVRGEDFQISSKSFQLAVLSTAKRRGLTVKTRVDGDIVTFQVTGKKETDG